jgi:hypothetical protein
MIIHERHLERNIACLATLRRPADDRPAGQLSCHAGSRPGRRKAHPGASGDIRQERGGGWWSSRCGMVGFVELEVRGSNDPMLVQQ